MQSGDDLNVHLWPAVGDNALRKNGPGRLESEEGDSYIFQFIDREEIEGFELRRFA